MAATKIVRGSWPPNCEMPDCREARLAGALREVDFGTHRRVLALCASHLERVGERIAKRR